MAQIEATTQATGLDPVEIGIYQDIPMSVTLTNFGRKFVLTMQGKLIHQAGLGSNPKGNLIRLDNALAQMPQRMQFLWKALPLRGGAAGQNRKVDFSGCGVESDRQNSHRPCDLAFDLFTLVYIGMISLIQLVGKIAAILGVAVLVTYSQKNGLILLTIAFPFSHISIPALVACILERIQSVAYRLKEIQSTTPMSKRRKP